MPCSGHWVLNTRAIVMMALLPLTLAGCGKGEADKGGGMPFGQGPVPVEALTVEKKDIPFKLEFPARVSGSREVEVRGRVTGILLKRNFKEGDKVAAGQSLFVIDPVPFQAAVARAAADVAAAEARHAQATRERNRLKPLIEAKAISQKEYDDSVSADEITAADLGAARANLTEQRLNLKYTRVESPISGIAGREYQSEGTLVSGPEVLLTRVTQVDPVHVRFGIPDNQSLKLQSQARAGQVSLPQGNRFQVRVRLPDGTLHPQAGVLDFSDVRIDPQTGTSERRAVVANPDHRLHPGQFVRVLLTGAVRPGAIQIPQRALLEGPEGHFVYVVREGKAQPQPVSVGDWDGKNWIVTKGLTAGDQVITEGIVKLGPGVPVKVADKSPPPNVDPQKQATR